MNSYRITKYNPNFRDKEDSFTMDDWTSISDVGNTFGGISITIHDYLLIENRYINCFVELMKLANVSTLQVRNLEGDSGIWRDGQLLSISEIEHFSRQCLREQIWGKLEHNRFFIHFGYDYYAYIGTSLPKDTVVKVCEENSLYCENKKSPYA